MCCLNYQYPIDNCILYEMMKHISLSSGYVSSNDVLLQVCTGLVYYRMELQQLRQHMSDIEKSLMQQVMMTNHEAHTVHVTVFEMWSTNDTVVLIVTMLPRVPLIFLLCALDVTMYEIQCTLTNCGLQRKPK